MENNFYDNEEAKFKNTITSLKSLPKIEAPDNFEYNLMVKIKNGNFELKTEPAKKSILWKILPTPAIVTAAILAFFLIPEEVVETNNLLQYSPIQVIDSAKQAEISAQSSLFNSNINSTEDNVAKNKTTDKPKNEKIYRMNVQENDVAVKQKMNIPFDPAKEVNIDEYIDGRMINNSNGSPANLVGGGDKSNSSFEGFIIKNKEERDSVQKSMTKTDSLRLNLKKKAIK